ncbi:MAG TPA: deoxyribonuclease V [Oculatellaceae cyanobacterium]|jgi:deoxyribonuclease V
MKIQQKHLWPLTIEEAIAIQQQLCLEITTEDNFGTVQYVAGVDVGYKDGGETTQAAVAVLSFPDLQLKAQAIARRPTTFPYVPGFLSFREIPAVLDALEKVAIAPDLILCDGHGIAHPRRFGIACHLGLLVDVPTIGVGKSLFVGKHDDIPEERGTWQPLVYRGETIGAVLRTRLGVKPIYVSSGNRISLATALEYVMRCTPKYRLPETTRWADKLASDKQ